MELYNSLELTEPDPSSSNADTPTCPFYRLQFNAKGFSLQALAEFRRSLGPVVRALKPTFANENLDAAALLFGHPQKEAEKESGGGVYPLTQFQLTDIGPRIVGFGTAAPAVQLVATALKEQIGDVKFNLPINVDRTDIDLQKAIFKSSEEDIFYTLRNWAALSGYEYKKFTDTRIDLGSRVGILQRCLDRQLGAMIARLYTPELVRQMPQARLHYLSKMHKVPLPVRGDSAAMGRYDQAIAFDITFSIPILLPPHAGIGRAVAHGLGQFHRRTRHD